MIILTVVVIGILAFVVTESLVPKAQAASDEPTAAGCAIGAVGIVASLVFGAAGIGLLFWLVSQVYGSGLLWR